MHWTRTYQPSGAPLWKLPHSHLSFWVCLIIMSNENEFYISHCLLSIFTLFVKWVISIWWETELEVHFIITHHYSDTFQVIIKFGVGPKGTLPFSRCYQAGLCCASHLTYKGLERVEISSCACSVRHDFVTQTLYTRESCSPPGSLYLAEPSNPTVPG